MVGAPRFPHYESTQEPLDDEERILMDPETWDWENAFKVEPGPNPSYIFDVRFSADEVTSIEQAADEKGMTIKEYLRDAALRSSGYRQESANHVQD